MKFLLIFLSIFSSIFCLEGKEKENPLDHRYVLDAPSLTIGRLSTKELEKHPHPFMKALAKMQKGHDLITLKPFNFAQNESITFFVNRPLMEQKAERYKIVITEDGKLIKDGLEMPDLSFFCLSTAGFLPGEEVEYIFRNDKGNFEYTMKDTPNPIEFKDKQGRILLQAQLVCLNPANYKISFSNIPENEPMKFESKSGREKTSHHFTCSEHCIIMYSPDVLGATKGVGKVTFTRKNGEKIKANFLWGEEFFDYILEKKIYKNEC